MKGKGREGRVGSAGVCFFGLLRKREREREKEREIERERNSECRCVGVCVCVCVDFKCPCITRRNEWSRVFGTMWRCDPLFAILVDSKQGSTNERRCPGLAMH